MDGMMRLPQQRVTASPRLGGSPPISTTDTGYPWVDGDVLCAADLNVAIAAAGAGNIGRNFIHNPLFNIAQRGAGPWTVSVYTADRWALSIAADTSSVSVASQNDTGRAQIGDEACWQFISNTFAGAVGASNAVVLAQRIEAVQRLSGKTVTVSFWSSGTAGHSLGVGLQQNFGTGGSPSPSVQLAGQAIVLSVAWTRNSITFAIPSFAGKVLGSNSNSFTELQFWYSAGANYASASGSIGTQSGSVNIWGVQLEIGSVATPLEKPDLRYDLSNCQRFAQIATFGARGFASAAGQHTAYTAVIPQMRAAPTQSAISGGSSANISSAPLFVNSNNSVQFDIISLAAGDYYATNAIYLLSADL